MASSRGTRSISNPAGRLCGRISRSHRSNYLMAGQRDPFLQVGKPRLLLRQRRGRISVGSEGSVELVFTLRPSWQIRTESIVVMAFSNPPISPRARSRRDLVPLRPPPEREGWLAAAENRFPYAGGHSWSPRSASSAPRSSSSAPDWNRMDPRRLRARLRKPSRRPTRLRARQIEILRTR